MVIGVVGFYFLLSDINSIISNTVKKEILFSSKLAMLEKVHISYNLADKTYKEAKLSLYKQVDKENFDLDGFYSQFPIFIREELKFHVYSIMLKPFLIFQKLKMDQINRIGDSLQIETFDKSNWLILNNIR